MNWKKPSFIITVCSYYFKSRLCSWEYWKITASHFWHVNHPDVSNFYRNIWLGMPQLPSLIAFFLQSLYWRHTWRLADPSQAASVTLWLTGAPWASVKQPWSAVPWASTPVQQPDTAEQRCRSTKFFRALSGAPSQPGDQQPFLLLKLSATT